MPAILFGSISTIADSSELQHGAFNDAFAKHGLDWHWERAHYQGLLQSSGGRQRIADEAERLGQDVDATAVHRSKSERFQEMLGGVGLSPRPGVLETIREAKERGWKLALVTTTAAENVAAIFASTGDKVSADDFDLLVDVTQVDTPKPDPAAFLFALEKLGESAQDCVAIEDNLGGVRSAIAAGIPVVAFPNENTVEHDFGATDCVYTLSFDELAARTSATAR